MFAARCVRRVLPLFDAHWLGGSTEARESISRAIALAIDDIEDIASNPPSDPDVYSRCSRVSKTVSYSVGGCGADYLVGATIHVCSAASHPQSNAAGANLAVAQAAGSAIRAGRDYSQTGFDAMIASLYQDYQHLVATVHDENWVNDSSVTSDVLRPL